jgi:DNA-binding Xre family transcriptional regulator
MTTKLSDILTWKEMSQRDLQRAIQDKFGVKIGDDRISKMVSGKLKNYHLQTAKMIAEALEVSIDDIVEL